MIIKSTRFLISNTDISKCPAPDLPEYAFIGRSNVGKSSLINMLLGEKKLAKTSSLPGKTQTINHFLINENWLIADLPGIGYAKTSKSNRRAWSKMISWYLTHRENLMCTFFLIDSRLNPQSIDLDFMLWLGSNSIPFAMVFTKTDKLKTLQLKSFQKVYTQVMLDGWDELPNIFISSSTSKSGQKEILDYIDQTNRLFKPD